MSVISSMQVASPQICIVMPGVFCRRPIHLKTYLCHRGGHHSGLSLSPTWPQIRLAGPYCLQTNLHKNTPGLNLLTEFVNLISLVFCLYTILHTCKTLLGRWWETHKWLHFTVKSLYVITISPIHYNRLAPCPTMRIRSSYQTAKKHIQPMNHKRDDRKMK